MDFFWKWEQVFKVADNVGILLILTVWQHLCSPCVPAGQTSRAGPPACPSPSVLGNPFSLPPSHLTWDYHSYNCLLGCTAINSLQVLFLELVNTQTTLFLCQEHKRFKSSGNLDPNWAGFRCHMSGHFQNVYGRTFTGLPHEVRNAMSSLSD